MKFNVKFAFSMITVAIIGCGGGAADLPDMGTVSGIVKIDGKATPDVIVTFSPVEGGRGSSGVTDSSGHYKLTYNSAVSGAVIGKHKVFVAGNVEFDPNDPDATMNPPEGNVPEKYTEMEKQVEVKSGSNKIDLTYP